MAAPLIDIHTHQLSQTEGVISVVNLALADDMPREGLFSLGIHPWAMDAEDFDADAQLKDLENKLLHPSVIALGEAGLDRLHKPSFERQCIVFQRQIALSERFGKPMIIHNVKCNNEIIAFRKKLAPCQPWILHGFNGTPQDVSQFARQGLYFSVGDALLHPERKVREALKSIPLECLFFETDTATISVESIYREAASLLEMSVFALQEQIFVNFARIFGNDYGRLAR